MESAPQSWRHFSAPLWSFPTPEMIVQDWNAGSSIGRQHHVAMWRRGHRTEGKWRYSGRLSKTSVSEQNSAGLNGLGYRWMEDLGKVLLSGKWDVLLGGDLGAESVRERSQAWEEPGRQKKDWEKEELSVSWVTSDTLPEDREVLTFSSTLLCLFLPCPIHLGEKFLLNFIFYHISFY